MSECVYADDDYLVAMWPQVVISSPGTWLVTVVSVAAGDYTITVGGVPYVYTADGTETIGEVRSSLLAAVSLSLSVAVMQVGGAALLLQQVQQAALTVAASGPSGPAPSELTITQTGGSDNTAARAFWLEAAKCGVPCCEFFQRCACSGTDCTADFTRWHASYAAHLLFVAINTSPTGYSATDFDRMRLGPADLERAKVQYATVDEANLGSTAAGRYVLSLRRRYLPPVWCG